MAIVEYHVGKTAMVEIFTRIRTDVTMENDTATLGLELYDTSSKDEHRPSRKLACVNAEIILNCFAIDDRRSYWNIYNEWDLEVSFHAKHIPTIVVGTKKDLRDGLPNLSPQLQGRYKLRY
ncbi:Putative small GTPase, P-loop containing nucleoside triphosphate hydrolase [Septoria linicola]|uniref:Small GTPase, P-loop containing nucleoside triphosphate hydrolase n=1 Tax=Septoria linicola TaxID=215465 RepID=A0A9Q9EHU9_9PEZI|nr:putative small GTPase, P-loop containing nucleoside triphosphate hydrolase [Septoria linicola]USW50399.1 Putative small GTPase, P-loop containing nucleoside triphosphate hydrolase [Septoria linicola]